VTHVTGRAYPWPLTQRPIRVGLDLAAVEKRCWTPCRPGAEDDGGAEPGLAGLAGYVDSGRQGAFGGGGLLSGVVAR